MFQLREPVPKPCFLCGTTDETVAVNFKDGSFVGVLCFAHLKQIYFERYRRMYANAPRRRSTTATNKLKPGRGLSQAFEEEFDA